MNRACFNEETVSGVFPRLERRIYTVIYLVCFWQHTLGTINVPFKQELQIALDCTPKLFTVDLMRCKNCESKDPLTHMASLG